MSGQLPVYDPEREVREHLTTAEWRSVVASIAERHGLAAIELEPFPSGSDVVWGTLREVIKLTAPRWTAAIEAEVHWGQRLPGCLPFRTPEVVASGELQGWPYVVLTRVPGRATAEVWPKLDHVERQAYARALGAAVRELHAVDVATEPDDWAAFFGACLRDVPARHAEPGVPALLIEEIPALLDAVGELRAEDHVLLHTEVLDQHVLVEPEPAGSEVRIAGLIDFADARIGPPEYEFAAPVEFVFRSEPGLLAAFLCGYGAPPISGEEAQLRRLAWALTHRFGRLRRQLEAVGPPVPTSLAELARRLFGATADTARS